MVLNTTKLYHFSDGTLKDKSNTVLRRESNAVNRISVISPHPFSISGDITFEFANGKTTPYRKMYKDGKETVQYTDPSGKVQEDEWHVRTYDVKESDLSIVSLSKSSPIYVTVKFSEESELYLGEFDEFDDLETYFEGLDEQEDGMYGNVGNTTYQWDEESDVFIELDDTLSPYMYKTYTTKTELSILPTVKAKELTLKKSEADLIYNAISKLEEELEYKIDADEVYEKFVEQLLPYDEAVDLDDDDYMYVLRDGNPRRSKIKDVLDLADEEALTNRIRQKVVTSSEDPSGEFDASVEDDIWIEILDD